MIPFVFLARLNALAVIPFIAFFSVLATGGDIATQESNLPTDFLLVLVSLILLFMTVIEYLGRRRALGGSYITPGLARRCAAAIAARAAEGAPRVSHLLSEEFWTSVIAGGLVAGMPLMFASIGETISERSGVLNIGLEGMMLFGAYAGFLGAYYGHSQWLGFLAGGLAGMGASLIMVVLCVWLGLDQIVVGIAITLGGGGITSVAQQAEFGASYPRLGSATTVSIPLLDRLPIARVDASSTSRSSSTSPSSASVC